MRREYVECYVGRYLGGISKESLADLLLIASVDPDGEEAGLVKLAASIGVPPVQSGCCVSCGSVLADFGFVKGRPLWCVSHKPDGSVYCVSHREKRERYEMCLENARFQRCERES